MINKTINQKAWFMVVPVLALVAFRVMWGFVGGYHARFANFVKGPLAVLRWLRQSSGQSSGKKGIEQPREIGHSPIAAYSVLALLAVAGFMAMSGTMSNDGILFDGPLAHLVPNFTRDATKAHHFSQYIVFALVGLHVVNQPDNCMGCLESSLCGCKGARARISHDGPGKKK